MVILEYCWQLILTMEYRRLKKIRDRELYNNTLQMLTALVDFDLQSHSTCFYVAVTYAAMARAGTKMTTQFGWELEWNVSQQTAGDWHSAMVETAIKASRPFAQQLVSQACGFLPSEQESHKSFSDDIGSVEHWIHSAAAWLLSVVSTTCGKAKYTTRVRTILSILTTPITTKRGNLISTPDTETY